MRKRYISLTLALTLALLLCACGSGEGGKSGEDGSGGISQGGAVAGQGDVGGQNTPGQPETPDGQSVPVGPSIRTLCTGWGSTCAGVLPDGTLVAADNDGAIEFPEDWNDIVAVDIGSVTLAVVHEDGTVSSISLSSTREVRDRDWTDILDVAVCMYGNVVGLKSDGTVVSDFPTDTHQYSDLVAEELSEWRDIIAIDSGEYNVFGLRSDGTVVATNFHSSLDANLGQADVGDWTDIVAISAGDTHTVGLRADGTVVVSGPMDQDKCKVQDWTDIALIAAGRGQTVGVKTDGTVVLTGIDDKPSKVLGWSDVVAIDCDSYTVALFSDGRVENSRNHDYVDTSGWPALRMPDWCR